MTATKSQYYSRIIGTGMGVPERIVPNSEFESYLDTSDEWIRTRTGIETRHLADPKKNETTLTMAHTAALSAIEQAKISAKDIDLIIVGTVSPENIMPTTANQLQALLGAKGAFSFDLQAACSGYVYAMSIADQYIRSGAVKNALIIGAETLSTLTNWRDRSTCVLFGDAAGASILQRTDNEDHAILATKLYSDGRFGEILSIPHGYTKVPVGSAEYRSDMHKIQMKGGELFKHAVRNMVTASQSALASRELTTKDLDFVIVHQANMRIIDLCLKMLDIPKEKTWINVQKYGNTSAATLPICLREASDAGAIKPGDLVLMATFGGGLTWGSALVRI